MITPLTLYATVFGSCAGRCYMFDVEFNEVFKFLISSGLISGILIVAVADKSGHIQIRPWLWSTVGQFMSDCCHFHSSFHFLELYFVLNSWISHSYIRGKYTFFLKSLFVQFLISKSPSMESKWAEILYKWWWPWQEGHQRHLREGRQNLPCYVKRQHGISCCRGRQSCTYSRLHATVYCRSRRRCSQRRGRSGWVKNFHSLRF